MLVNFIVILFAIQRGKSWCLDSSTITTGQRVVQLDYSPNMQYIVLALQTETRVYHAGNRSIRCTYSHGSVNFGSVKFLPSNDKIAFAIEQDSIRIISASTCSLINSFPTGHAKIADVDFNQDGSKMLTCGDDSKFKVWDATSAAFLTGTPPMIGGNFNVGEKIWSCEFSYDEYVIIGSENNVVKIYGPNFGNSVYFQRTHSVSGRSNHVAFYHCQKDKYIMGSDNGMGYAWNNTNALLTTGSLIRLAIVDITNSFLVFGNENYELKFVFANNFAQVQTLTLSSKIFSGDFTDNGQTLAVGFEDGYVKFVKRCGCASDSLSYNTTYCPASTPIVCGQANNSSNSTNSSNSSGLNISNSSTNTSDSSNSSSWNNFSANASNSNSSISFNSSSNSSQEANSTFNSSIFNTSIINSTNQSFDTNFSNTANQTWNQTLNMTDNAANVTNQTQDSQQLTIQQLFALFGYREILALPQRQDLNIATIPGQHCNSLLTKIKVSDHTCDAYLKWRRYIRLFHPSLLQTNIYCDQTDPFLILIDSLIKNAISDPDAIYVIMPKSSLIPSATMPVFNWREIFTKVSANYTSTLEPALYSAEECAKEQSTRSFLIVSFALTCIIMVVGIPSAKIVGLEMFGILQVAYISLACYRSLNINLQPLRELRYFNGFNINIEKQASLLLPNSISSLGVSSQFLNNFNVTGLICASVLVLLGAFYLLAIRLHHEQCAKISIRLLKQAAVTFALFNALNIGFSAGLHFKYAIHSSSLFSTLSSISLLVVLAGVLTLVVLLQSLQNRSFGQFKTKFKNSFSNQCYISLSMLYRLSLGFYIGYQNQNWESTLLAFAGAFFFLMYFIIQLPFSDLVQNYRAGIIHLSTLGILFTSYFYCSIKLDTPNLMKSHMHSVAIFELIMIGVCLAVSLFSIVYEIWVFFSRCKKQKRKAISNISTSIDEIKITEENQFEEESSSP